MHTIKNLTNSPQDLDAVTGPVRLPAFGTVTAEFGPAYLAMLEGFGLYEVAKDQAEPDKGEPTDETDIDALRERAEGLGINVDGRWGVKRIEAEIAKAMV